MASEQLRARLERARASVAEREFAAALITPGPSLRYLTGYDAVPLERLTCLVLLGDDVAPVLLVPRLEEPAAIASGVVDLGITVTTWDETHDPYALIADLLPTDGIVALDDQMWAQRVLRFREAMPAAIQTLAGPLVDDLRMRKSSDEIGALRDAGAAIDRVHARMGEWLRVGRTEREVGRDIAEAILSEGHERVDFVIVASGPNGASPHHELSDRVIAHGDPVVVDIGGTTAAGYCSDETRMYAMGEVDPMYARDYAVLQRAQEAAVEHARPGVTAESVDAAARSVLADAGLGEVFIHRTGHGIGMSTHEEPYIVSGNDLVLEPGMAFSIEPGFYLSGRWGARIEDIVVVTGNGCERLNLRPRDLVIV
jgi:Xaa-Pro aminopeptidase